MCLATVVSSTFNNLTRTALPWQGACLLGWVSDWRKLVLGQEDSSCVLGSRKCLGIVYRSRQTVQSV